MASTSLDFTENQDSVRLGFVAPVSTTESERRYHPKPLEEALALAIRLQSEHEQNLSEEQIVAIGQEAGVDPRFVRRQPLRVWMAPPRVFRSRKIGSRLDRYRLCHGVPNDGQLLCLCCTACPSFLCCPAVPTGFARRTRCLPKYLSLPSRRFLPVGSDLAAAVKDWAYDQERRWARAYSSVS